eukprot:CAMPEP_0171273062 /NCGR_PEP_ID=MMETSP0790-20130122/62084_1 /TAXON_ID=2925 /ORGANISM="Alexandrium catenella, Strain OF101" /LENGTH=65 /DNA_ID=CAMNT_0011742025 /DNA_START=53 /DNA_END=247 /DNA_ORIENTATION=-
MSKPPPEHSMATVRVAAIAAAFSSSALSLSSAGGAPPAPEAVLCEASQSRAARCVRERQHAAAHA